MAEVAAPPKAASGTIAKAGAKDAKGTQEVAVEDPMANVREMEMLTIGMPPDACVQKVSSSYVSMLLGGGGNLLGDPDKDFLTSLLEDTNVIEMLPEFRVVRSNPQNCDRNMTINEVGKDGKVQIIELKLMKLKQEIDYPPWHQKLIGTIPDNIGNLKLLTIINLSFNGLTGEIPESVDELTSLEEFWAGHNELTGRIPMGFCTLKSLKKLSLNANKLCGKIPKELAKFPKDRINLTHNYLEDIENMEVFFAAELETCETYL